MLKLLRLTAFGLFSAIAIFLGTIICLFRPRHPNNTWFMCQIFGWGFRFILRTNVIVENLEILQTVTPRVVICNHQSNWDMFIWANFIPKRMVSLGKKEIAYLPVFGLLFWLAGNVLINRQRRDQATQTMSEAAQAIRQRNISLIIFPEGTRSKGRGLLPFKKGAFFTAVEAKVPILPIVINHYAETMDFSRWDGGYVRVSVLPPIPTASLTEADIPDLLTSCETLIGTELDKINLRTNLVLE